MLSSPVENSYDLEGGAIWSWCCRPALVPVLVTAKVLSRVLDSFSPSPPEIWSLTPLCSQTALTPAPLDLSCLLLLWPALTQHFAGPILKAQFSDLVLDRLIGSTYGLTKPSWGGGCQALQAQSILMLRLGLPVVSPSTNQRKNFQDTKRHCIKPTPSPHLRSWSALLACPGFWRKLVLSLSYLI